MVSGCFCNWKVWLSINFLNHVYTKKSLVAHQKELRVPPVEKHWSKLIYPNYRTHTDKTWTCQHCKKSFTAKRVWLRHLHRIHPKSSRFTCQHCDKHFPTQESMTKHIAALHADRAWACSYCQNFYATKKLMLRHTQTFHQVQSGAFNPIILP